MKGRGGVTDNKGFIKEVPPPHHIFFSPFLLTHFSSLSLSLPPSIFLPSPSTPSGKNRKCQKSETESRRYFRAPIIPQKYHFGSKVCSFFCFTTLDLLSLQVPPPPPLLPLFFETDTHPLLSFPPPSFFYHPLDRKEGKLHGGRGI